MTENLKAVLTESDFIERLEAMENDLLSKANFEGDAMYYFAQVTNAAKNEISRLAAEVVRLRDTPSNNDHFYMDGHSVGLAENENRVKELESKLKAWEDAPMVEVSGQELVDYTGDHALDGTYHLKPAEADDEVV